MVTLIGALVFIGFAIASLFIDPYEENHLVPDVEASSYCPHNNTINSHVSGGWSQLYNIQTEQDRICLNHHHHLFGHLGPM